MTLCRSMLTGTYRIASTLPRAFSTHSSSSFNVRRSTRFSSGCPNALRHGRINNLGSTALRGMSSETFEPSKKEEQKKGSKDRHIHLFPRFGIFFGLTSLFAVSALTTYKIAEHRKAEADALEKKMEADIENMLRIHTYYFY